MRQVRLGSGGRQLGIEDTHKISRDKATGGQDARDGTCLIHLYGGNERAPSLSDDVDRALDGRQLAGERRSHARVSDLRNHNHDHGHNHDHNHDHDHGRRDVTLCCTVPYMYKKEHTHEH